MNIGIVISGGDGSGINNFLHNVNIMLDYDKFYLYNGGLNGLLRNSFVSTKKHELLDFSLLEFPCIQSGRTSKILDHKDKEIIYQNLKQESIDILILCGGNGSLSFLSTFQYKDLICYGIPLTVDNDLEGSDYTIGYPTALEVIKNDVVRIRNSGHALPNRIFMLEVLGGYCGELALNSAIISNADFAFIPELEIDMDKVCKKITEKLSVQNSVIIICSEGCAPDYKPGDQGFTRILSEEIEKKTGIRVRQTILGYGQRNGIPNTEELFKSQLLALYLKQALDNGLKNIFIGLQTSGEASYIDLKDIKTKIFNEQHPHIKLAKIKGII
ncbi:MAG: 6-phosphofructokinase [Brevinema sp.]